LLDQYAGRIFQRTGKNIAEPVKIYRIIDASATSTLNTEQAGESRVP
jgi:hypothetical protein